MSRGGHMFLRWMPSCVGMATCTQGGGEFLMGAIYSHGGAMCSKGATVVQGDAPYSQGRQKVSRGATGAREPKGSFWEQHIHMGRGNFFRVF